MRWCLRRFRIDHGGPAAISCHQRISFDRPASSTIRGAHLALDAHEPAIPWRKGNCRASRRHASRRSRAVRPAPRCRPRSHSKIDAPGDGRSGPCAARHRPVAQLCRAPDQTAIVWRRLQLAKRQPQHQHRQLEGPATRSIVPSCHHRASPFRHRSLRSRYALRPVQVCSFGMRAVARRALGRADQPTTA